MTTPPSAQKYHEVAPFNYHLLDRLRVSFEENLHEQGIEFLNNVSFAGISSQPPIPSPIPPPPFLRFLLTLLVHPYYTTQRRKNVPSSEAPTRAFLTLSRLLKTFGPHHLNLNAVYDFSRSDRGNRERRRHQQQQHHHPKDDASAQGDERISHPLALEESIFSSVDDIWGIIGWAFSCSIHHKPRWNWWKLFLEFLIESLELDWRERLRLYEKGGGKDGGVLGESLVVRLLPENRGSGGYRRVLRAIFAGGKEEWGMLWEDELMTKRLRKPGRARIDRVVGEEQKDDMEDEEDFLEEGEEQEEEDITMDDVDQPRSAAYPWGGMQSFIFRQRLLELLSLVSSHNLFIPTQDFYLELRDLIFPHPVSTLKLFVSPLLDTHDTSYSLLSQHILLTLLPNPPKTFDFTLTQDILITHFLPFCASSQSPLNNARVAVLLQVLFQLLMRRGFVSYSLDLEAAVKEGRRKRREKVGSPKGKARKELEEVRQDWNMAEDGLLFMVALLKSRKDSGERR
ncbi:hypothetical protein BZA77DRAFT_387814 [Pyronema omphalodes]|nr:hypothetical protein BZA77DRAFT_387814 [Pyronema omphalodes]